MNRRGAMRKIIQSSAAAPLLAADIPAAPEYYELRYYQLRNGYSKKLLPAKPSGGPPIGVFTPLIGENSPFVLMLLTYGSLADAEHAPDFDFDYVRFDRTLLRAFPRIPRMQKPPETKAGYIFELRTYESDNASTLQKKIAMFQDAEAGIFRRLGMNPMFFGEALIGNKLPHLSYMLAFEDLPARDRLWKAFGADSEWQKLRATPGLSDADIVSNISNVILRSAPISDIR